MQKCPIFKLKSSLDGTYAWLHPFFLTFSLQLYTISEPTLTPHSIAPDSTRNQVIWVIIHLHTIMAQVEIQLPTLANTLSFSPSMANVSPLFNPYKYLYYSFISFSPIRQASSWALRAFFHLKIGENPSVVFLSWKALKGHEIYNFSF